MIKTYEAFVNENLVNESFSFDKDKFEKALNIIKNKLTFEKLDKIFKKYKSKILSFIKKFTNGKDVVYLDKISTSTNTSNEGFKDTWFYENFIEIFTEDGFGGILMGGILWLTTLLAALLVYLLGYLIYMGIFYNPMDQGIVKSIEFTPAHYTTYTTFIQSGKVQVPITNTIQIPDTYEVTIKELNSEETEKWTTTNLTEGEKISKGDTLQWNEDLFSVSKMK